jgi:hypothetical protein
MTRLDAIRKNLLDMDQDELLAHIRRIRADRKIRKETATVKKTKAKTQSKTNDKLLKALGGLTEDQIKALLGDVEDEGSASPDEVDHSEGSSED